MFFLLARPLSEFLHMNNLEANSTAAHITKNNTICRSRSTNMRHTMRRKYLFLAFVDLVTF